jgi:hypothetical protein
MTVVDDRPRVRKDWANKHRASWQTSPCPSWCRNDHEDKDWPRYRVCESLFTGPRQSLQKPVVRDVVGGIPMYGAPMVPMMLVRGWHQTETTIVIGIEADGDDPYLMTLSEAEELRDKLDALIKLGREGDQ